MNQNLSRQKVLIGGAVAIALVVAGFLLLSRVQKTSAEGPLQVVEAIYRHCQAGEHDRTAGYFSGGPAADGEMRIAICLKITQAKTIKGWEVVSDATGGADAAILTRNLRDGDDGRILKWRLARKAGRWLVLEVV